MRYTVAHNMLHNSRHGSIIDTIMVIKNTLKKNSSYTDTYVATYHGNAANNKFNVTILAIFKLSKMTSNNLNELLWLLCHNTLNLHL